MAHESGKHCFQDPFLEIALLDTLAAQVGNHCIGLGLRGHRRLLPLPGLIKAMMVHGYEDKSSG